MRRSRWSLSHFSREYWCRFCGCEHHFGLKEVEEGERKEEKEEEREDALSGPKVLEVLPLVWSIGVMMSFAGEPSVVALRFLLVCDVGRFPEA